MAEKSARRDTSQADAVAHIREGETFAINLPVIGQVEIPRPEQLAYYGGLAALASALRRSSGRGSAAVRIWRATLILAVR